MNSHGEFNHQKNIADYFLVAGLSHKPEDYVTKQLPEDAEEILKNNVTLDFRKYQTPIVDIRLLHLKKTLKIPPGYTVIEKTFSKRFDASIKQNIKIIYKRSFSEKMIKWIGLRCEDSDKYVRLKETLTKDPVHLTPNKASISFSLLNLDDSISNQVVTDIVIINSSEGEKCPLSYIKIATPILKSNFPKIQLHLCYHMSYVKQCLLLYEPDVLFNYNISQGDRNKGVDLKKIANFCLPWGATLESWNAEQKDPENNFFSFVLTTESYEQIYGYALNFYEPYDIRYLDLEKCFHLSLEPEIWSETKKQLSDAPLVIDPQRPFLSSKVGKRVVGVSKSICILSRNFYSTSIKKYLDFILKEVRRSSVDAAQFEKMMAFLFHGIPFPTPLYPEVVAKINESDFQFTLPSVAEKRSRSHYAMYLLKSFDPQILIEIFVHLLTEQKILMTSLHQNSLSSAGQAFLNMIKPLKWAVSYIPFIHMSLVQVIQSPSPFLIGVDSRFFDFFQIPSSYGIACIDLDTKNFIPAKMEDNNYISTNLLPRKIYKTLLENLIKLRQLRDTDQTKEIEIGKLVAREFEIFLVNLFGGYREYLIRPSLFRQGELFNTEKFIFDKRDYQKFFTIFLSTQLWANFIRDRTYPSDHELEYLTFDFLIEEYFRKERLDSHTDRKNPITETEDKPKILVIEIKFEDNELDPSKDTQTFQFPINLDQSKLKHFADIFLKNRINVISQYELDYWMNFTRDKGFYPLATERLVIDGPILWYHKLLIRTQSEINKSKIYCDYFACHDVEYTKFIFNSIASIMFNLMPSYAVWLQLKSVAYMKKEKLPNQNYILREIFKTLIFQYLNFYQRINVKMRIAYDQSLFRNFIVILMQYRLIDYEMIERIASAFRLNTSSYCLANQMIKMYYELSLIHKVRPDKLYYFNATLMRKDDYDVLYDLKEKPCASSSNKPKAKKVLQSVQKDNNESFEEKNVQSETITPRKQINTPTPENLQNQPTERLENNIPNEESVRSSPVPCSSPDRTSLNQEDRSNTGHIEGDQIPIPAIFNMITNIKKQSGFDNIKSAISKQCDKFITSMPGVSIEETTYPNSNSQLFLNNHRPNPKPVDSDDDSSEEDVDYSEVRNLWFEIIKEIWEAPDIMEQHTFANCYWHYIYEYLVQMKEFTHTQNSAKSESVEPEEDKTRSSDSRISPEKLLVSLSTCTKCKECDQTLFDEEILALFPNNDTSETINCIYCSEKIVPQLFIEISCLYYDDESSTKTPVPQPSDQDEGSVRQDKPERLSLAQVHVSYLNPLLLRNNIEKKLSEARDGIWLPSIDAFNKKQDVLWNIVWWSYRIGFPLHLLDKLQDWLLFWQKRQNSSALSHQNMYFTEFNATVNLDKALEVSVIGRWNELGPKRQSSQFLYYRYDQLLKSQPTRDENKAEDQTVAERLVMDPSGRVQVTKCFLDYCLNECADAIDKRNYSEMVRQLVRLRKESIKNESIGYYPSCDHEIKCPLWPKNRSIYREIIFFIVHRKGHGSIDYVELDRDLRKACVDCNLFSSDKPLIPKATLMREVFRPLHLSSLPN